MRLFSHYLAVNELFTLEVAAESGARRAIGLRVLSRHYRVGQVSNATYSITKFITVVRVHWTTNLTPLVC